MSRVISKYRRDGFSGLCRGAQTQAIIHLQNGLTSHVPRLHSFMYRKPLKILLETSNKCNLQCEMCIRGKRVEGFMEKSLFARLMKEIAEIGNVAVSLQFGGEPLLHPDFMELVEIAISRRKKLHNIGFFTNGMLLTDEIARCLVDNQVDWVTFSVDGVGETQERIRKGSKYKTVKANINNLLAVRGNKVKPFISTTTTISSQSDEELDWMWKAWHSKVDSVEFGPCNDDTFKIINGHRLGHETLPKFCLYPFYMLSVTWNGNVGFCCMDLNGEGVAGNVENESLMEIWRGKEMKRIRQGILYGCLSPNEVCGKCQKFRSNNL